MLRRLDRFLFLALILLLFFSGLGSAEESNSPTLVPTPAPELSSPRATMETFLKAFYAEGGPDLDEAASCLDLSRLPTGLRGSLGRDLAVQLKAVLDRSEYIDVSKISGSPDGPSWKLKLGEDGEVVLSRLPDGRWLFSGDTVENLGRLYSLVESKKVVEGVEKTVTDRSVGGWLRKRVPSGLRDRHFLLEAWQWMGLAILILLGFILNRLFLLILMGPILSLLRRRFQEIRGERVRYLLRPVGMLMMLLLWWFGLMWLALPVSFLSWYAGFVEIALIVVLCLTAYRLVEIISGVLERRAAQTENKFDDLLVPLIRKSLKVLIVVIGAILVSQAFGQDLKALLAGLGIGGLALALAAQDTIGNLFGSLTVLLDRPFQVGDWVKIGDVEGTVAEVGFRSTRIRTFYDSMISLPNSHLTSAAVDNLGLRQYRRWSTRLGLAYDTPPEKVEAFCEGVRELVRRHPQTRKDSFHVYFNEFGSSSLEILFYIFFQCPDWSEELRARHRLAVEILQLAAALGVEFAFPTQTLYLRKEEWNPRLPDLKAGRVDLQGLFEEAREAAAGISEGQPEEVQRP